MKFKTRNSHNSIVFLGIIYSITFIIFLFGFSQNNRPTKIDFIYSFCFLATVIPPSIINLYLLIPSFLKKEKHLIYTSLFILTTLSFSQLNIWFFDSFIDFIFPSYYFISYHSNTELIFIFSFFLIITALIRLSEEWIYLNYQKNENLKLEKQQIQLQLNSLKSQINPHFLFNSLNVIYSLALEKKEETTKAIIQLSDILRYVIYDSNTKKVKLKDEILLLKNYIEFQKLRHPKSAKINLEAQKTNESIEIYPMLLLPLVENSFKHGFHDTNEHLKINININYSKGELFFLIENNYDKEMNIKKIEHSGIGLKNIKKNLELVYPKKHYFETSKTDKLFTVSLKINYNEN